MATLDRVGKQVCLRTNTGVYWMVIDDVIGVRKSVITPHIVIYFNASNSINVYCINSHEQIKVLQLLDNARTARMK